MHSFCSRVPVFLLLNPINEVVPRFRADYAAHLPNVQGKRCLLEGLLHHAPPEGSQVSIGPITGTVRPLGGIPGEGSINPLGFDLGFVLLQFGQGILGGRVDLLAGAARDRIAATRVLNEQVSAAYR